MFVGLGLSSVVPVIHGVILNGYRQMNERMGLAWVLLKEACISSAPFCMAVSKLLDDLPPPHCVQALRS